MIPHGGRILQIVEFVVTIPMLFSGLRMVHYGKQAYRNLSPDLDQTNYPLPGRAKPEDYSDVGRLFLARARQWQSIMLATMVVGAAIIIVVAEIVK